MKTTHRNIIKSTSAVIAVLAATCIVQSILNVSAWGPDDRDTFTLEQPAPHPTFNSITDNPILQDERNFVRIREAGVGNFGNEVQLVPGKEYEVYSYFHNNAASNLNTSGKGIAQGVRMKSQYPSIVKPGERAMVSSEITATNTIPTSVWDEAYMTTTSTVALRYVQASAVIHTEGAADGRVLSTDLFSSTGTYLGYNILDGLLPGCAEYSGYVVYRLVVEQPNFTVEKSVTKLGENKWDEPTRLKPGDIVEYRIRYKNTGTVDQTNVIIKDTLPEGMTYIDGTTRLINNSDPTGGSIISSNEITKSGINLGLYGPGSEAVIIFQAQLTSGDNLTCGETPLINMVLVSTDNGSKNSSATVIVNNDDPKCQEPVIPEVLPKAGPLESILVITAVLGLSLGVTYWYRSRQALQKAVRTNHHTQSSTAHSTYIDELTEEPQKDKQQ